MSLNSLIVVEDVSYWHNSLSLTLENISFRLEEADLLGIIGPNGAGKTTLFECMLGLLSQYKGTIKVFGQDIKKNRAVLKQIGYVPQQHHIERNFPATVEEVISLGLIAFNKENKKSFKDKISSSIELMELSGVKHKRISELSGGQQQRVLIAKSLVCNPKILILDEPTTGIDQKTQDNFYDFIKRLNHEERISIILSSHDLDAISKLANKVACINRRMFFHGNTLEFFGNENLIKTYYESSMQAHMRLHGNTNTNTNVEKH